MLKKNLFLSLIILLSLFSSAQKPQSKQPIACTDITDKDIKVGAARTDIYYPWIKDKNIAVVANQTSVVGEKHLVDQLLEDGFKITKIFCPEHGFRGEGEAGETISNEKDSKTGVPIVSIYGSKKKPSVDDLKNIDVVLFDIQDIGVRFYTYISTMHYVMEACAENAVQFIVLDRPNPNGHYIDGPVLKEENKSFIGMHPIPIVHGLTIAELACMINGEKWLKNEVVCDLKYVTVEGYKHNLLYQIPINPSPNIRSMTAVYLYPSLGLFEGTVVSVGRGTDIPFEIYGHPDLKQNTNYNFTPKAMEGLSTNPKFLNQICHGYQLENFCTVYIKHVRQLYLFWLLEAVEELGKNGFFLPSFNLLAGDNKLQEMIVGGAKEKNIRNSWKNDIETYKEIRKKYLLYPDFE
jgi:uncharacterized protein YbbC (DUF1343 family)